MKTCTSLLIRIWNRLRGNTALPQLARAKSRPSTRPRPSSIEPLEGRIAPAVLLPGGTGISYQDLDGDKVTVTFSKALLKDGTFTGGQLAALAFSFTDETGSLSAFGDTGQQNLQVLDMTIFSPAGNGADSPAQGVGISILSAKIIGGTGDGFVNVGTIRGTTLNATETSPASNIPISFGAVKVDGNLERITAGGYKALTTGIASLSVQSLGKLGTGAPDAEGYDSIVFGSIGTVTVLDSINEGTIFARTPQFQDNNPATKEIIGKIGNITIGDALAGRAGANSASNASDFTGLIFSASTIGAVKIGTGEVGDGIFGGGGASSGTVYAITNIASVSVNGSVLGNLGEQSGSVIALGSIGNATISGDLKVAADIAGGSNAAALRAGTKLGNVTVGGSVTGDSGVNTGAILAGEAIGNVTIRGSLLGGTGNASGFISSGLNGGFDLYPTGSMGLVNIGGSISGEGSLAATRSSGGILAAGKLAGVSIGTGLTGGSLVGGLGTDSGFVRALGDLGKVSVKTSIVGGDGGASGVVQAGSKLTSLTVGKSLLGGDGFGSGSISTGFRGVLGDAGLVTIGETIVGGDGSESGTIAVRGKLAGVSLGAKLLTPSTALAGGLGDQSGMIFSAGNMGAIKITGSVQGGAGFESGSIESTGTLTSVAISGSLTGGIGAGSGAVRAEDRMTGIAPSAGRLGTVTIGGSVLGGTGADSGQVAADGRITSVAVKGALLAGGAARAGSVLSGTGFLEIGDVTKVTVGDFGRVDTVNDQPVIRAGGSVIIEGTLKSFTATGMVNATLRAADQLGALSVGLGGVNGSTISARGQLTPTATADLAIASISVKGSVVNSLFLAGYNTAGTGLNTDAQIGAVSVTGNWTASDLVAGVRDANGNGFGDTGDTRIGGAPDTALLSRIASVVISGQIAGSSDGRFHGFTAEEIGSFKYQEGTVTKTLVLKAKTVDAPVELGTNVFVRELPATV